jgi:hypothetical protein
MICGELIIIIERFKQPEPHHVQRNETVLGEEEGVRRVVEAGGMEQGGYG